MTRPSAPKPAKPKSLSLQMATVWRSTMASPSSFSAA